MTAPFDLTDDSVVVVIGTGAGGGVLANELAQKGVSVVALEAGGRHLPQDFINDEWESFGQLAWLDPRTTSGDWRVAKDFSGLPAWIVKSVGGTTQHWAGASLRFQDHEWKAKTTYGDVQGANLLDWPIDPGEMDQWYTKAEDKLGVTRTAIVPDCRETIIIRSSKRVQRLWAMNKSTPAAWRSIRMKIVNVQCASRPAFASKDVNGVPSGRQATWTSLRAKRLGILRCAPNLTLHAFCTMTAARSLVWSTLTQKVICRCKRPALFVWLAIRL